MCLFVEFRKEKNSTDDDSILMTLTSIISTNVTKNSTKKQRDITASILKKLSKTWNVEQQSNSNVWNRNAQGSSSALYYTEDLEWNSNDGRLSNYQVV